MRRPGGGNPLGFLALHDGMPRVAPEVLGPAESSPQSCPDEALCAHPVRVSFVSVLLDDMV